MNNCIELSNYSIQKPHALIYQLRIATSQEHSNLKSVDICLYNFIQSALKLKKNKTFSYKVHAVSQSCFKTKALTCKFVGRIMLYMHAVAEIHAQCNYYIHASIASA